MQPEEVRKCLLNYRDYSARVAYLEAEIGRLRMIKESYERTIVEDNVSVTQKLSAPPHGSGVGDPVGILAQRLADGFKPEYIAEIQQEIADKEIEHMVKKMLVSYVDSWLIALNPRERFVIEKQYIGGMFWRETVYEFKERFGEFYTKQGLQKLRARALNKIYEIAE